jgi:hypothetical protein
LGRIAHRSHAATLCRIPRKGYGTLGFNILTATEDLSGFKNLAGLI